jgi:tripartite-type tricarboxylate transporter receptor subunit TctC
VVATLVIVFGAASAVAQTYPTRPVTLVVPFPAGGGNDTMARLVAEKLSKALGQQVVVDNRGGGGGTIASRAVAKAAPDGYTLLLGFTGTLAINPSLYPNPGYDPRTDFAPIGLIATGPSVLIAHPSFPAQSVGELIAYAKANPGKINYASASIGTVAHMSAELFAHMAEIKIVHVPYRGTGPAMTDLLGGHVGIMFASIPTAIGHVRSGSLRALAVTTATRSGFLPEVPTIAESGLPGYAAAGRYGLLAPAGTPRPIIERLNAELNTALKAEDLRAKLATEGAEPLTSTPEEFAADIDREETKWSKVVKETGVKIE